MKQISIENIYFFGSSKNGFNSYPPTNNFINYYRSSAPEQWLLTLRKTDNYVYHTYVVYGLLTSLTNGREGSCFGISLKVKGYYFKDVKFLHDEIFTQIINDMLKEKVLIDRDEFGKVGFIPLQLSDISNYLEKWTNNIIHGFRPEEINKYLAEITDKIPDYDDVYQLHINSNGKIIQEYFERYGGVDISNYEKYSVETKTFKQKEQLKNNDGNKKFKQRSNTPSESENDDTSDKLDTSKNELKSNNRNESQQKVGFRFANIKDLTKSNILFSFYSFMKKQTLIIAFTSIISLLFITYLISMSKKETQPISNYDYKSKIENIEHQISILQNQISDLKKALNTKQEQKKNKSGKLKIASSINNPARLRSSKSSNDSINNILKKLVDGEFCDSIEQNGNWYRVKCDGIEGWVSKSCIQGN
jgi:hypothetical protein